MMYTFEEYAKASVLDLCFTVGVCVPSFFSWLTWLLIPATLHKIVEASKGECKHVQMQSLKQTIFPTSFGQIFIVKRAVGSGYTM